MVTLGALSPSSRASASARSREVVSVRPQVFAPVWDFVGDLLSYIVLLYLFLAVCQLISDEHISTCRRSPYQRALNPDASGTALVNAKIRGFVFVYGIRLVQVLYCGMLWTLLPPLRRTLLYIYGLIFGLYLVGELLVEILKNYSGDMACHTKKSNGVSGHYYFITFNFFLVVYFGKVLRRSVDYSPFVPLIRLVALFLSISCLGLEGFFSFYYGYHSAKQIVYGGLLGMVFVAGAISGSEYLFIRHYALAAKSQ